MNRNIPTTPSEHDDLNQKMATALAKIDQLEGTLARITALLEEKASTPSTVQIDDVVKRHVAPIHDALFKMKTLNAMIARKQSHVGQKSIRVIFLVHNVECWDAVHELFLLMQAHPRFEPIAITLPRDFTNRGQFHQEDLNYNGLTELGITPIRFNDNNYADQLEMLKLMGPDIIFRQSPWDISIPGAFHFHEINFAKICYVPYGFSTVPFTPEQMNVLFMRSCWRAYTETETHAKIWSQYIAQGNLRVAGSAKLDRIVASSDVAEWPMPVEPGSTRIIWAPHHSLNAEQWLNFSTFMENHQAFLQLARECPQLQIVLKPHPTLFEKILTFGLMTHEELMAYLNEFVALPNTALVTGGNYLPLFWASDLMITDGIGFFSEYMVTGKPIIWTVNPTHVAMNDVVTKLTEGMYQAHEFESVVNYLEQLIVDKHDPLYDTRQELIKTIMPHPNRSAQFILEDIIAGIDEESAPTELLSAQ